ncbi:MAG: nitric oxide reductase activation protein NorD [Pseudomonadales bacterium]
MIELGPLEERLALFAEGIAGRYFHIKPSAEFAGRRARLAADDSAATSDTLYLPEQLDAPDASAYRVLALQQLGHREFGTFSFGMDTAVARLPGLSDREVPALGGRPSDFQRFYHQFEHPALASTLFQLCERARVDALMVQAYPGIRSHLQRLQAHRLRLDPPQPVTGLGTTVHALESLANGADPAELRVLDPLGLLELPMAALLGLMRAPGDVYAAAGTAMALYQALASHILRGDASLPLELLDELDDPASWMQREARLEDWRDDLAALDASLEVELLDGDEADVSDAEQLADGQLRPNDIDLRKKQSDRDTLARRIDMERSAIRDALGADQPHARSFRYDEWSYLERRYLPRWCRLFELRLAPDHEQELAGLQAVIRAHRLGVQKRLEQIKPLGYQRLSRLADGDELDFNAVIQARQDSRAGVSPDERVYSRRERVHRDVCAAFLVDLSASTDDALEPLPAPATDLEDDLPHLRDPYYDPRTDPLPLDASPSPESPPRRIIDVQREAMLVMSAALEQLGDSYGVYGFSGYGRDCVEFFVAKEPDEAFSRNVLAAIASMKPKRSTRMGPAIRHAVRKLIDSGNAMKVLLIISDGFPQDCDYGPERGEHEYGLQDTARALQEAQDKGVETFCVTVDRSGHDYLKRMCPDSRYLIIDDIEDLPEQLSKVYQTLTSR